MTDLDTISKQAAADNKARRESREQNRKAAEDSIAKQRQEQIDMNMAKMQAEAKFRPTPTPEEVAHARAGYVDLEKESDGAPLQNERHHILNPAQQIEVGRQMKSAEPVGSDADIANQKSLSGQAPSTDRSDVSATSTGEKPKSAHK